jgi:hypothetical protein
VSGVKLPGKEKLQLILVVLHLLYSHGNLENDYESVSDVLEA